MLLRERGDEVDNDLLESLVGRGRLRDLARSIGELLPPEYGWRARQQLKERLRQVGWMD